MPQARMKWWLLLCAAVFAAAVAGAVYCGEKMAECEDPQRAEHLLMLIYAHFALGHAALLAAAGLLYTAHRRWRRYYLIVGYNEKGMALDPPGIRMPARRVYRCHLGNMAAAQLPPPDAPTIVYPMFMLSGRSSGEKLEGKLRSAYGAEQPQLYYQPVLGASPWLAKAAAEYVRPRLGDGAGVLVVAHGSRMADAPPEPALFCRRLRELLPEGTEVQLGYFSQEPAAQAALAGMRASHVLLLPFLIAEGVHTRRDLPTREEAAACGKTLTRLPVVAELLHYCETR